MPKKGIKYVGEEVVCANCDTQLTANGRPRRECQHFKWYYYGNYCYSCALFNKEPGCDFISDIRICKDPMRRAVYVWPQGSGYYVLARRK